MNELYHEWYEENMDMFDEQGCQIILSRLSTATPEQFEALRKVKLKKPGTAFIFALLAGIDRFYLKEYGIGIVKILSYLVFPIWYIIDLFTVKIRTYNYNLKQVSAVLGFSVQKSKNRPKMSKEDKTLMKKQFKNLAHSAKDFHDSFYIN